MIRWCLTATAWLPLYAVCFSLVVILVGVFTAQALSQGLYWILSCVGFILAFTLDASFWDINTLKNIARNAQKQASPNTLKGARNISTFVLVQCLVYAGLSLIFAGLPVVLGIAPGNLRVGNALVETMFILNAIVLLVGAGISGAASVHLYRMRNMESNGILDLQR